MNHTSPPMTFSGAVSRGTAARRSGWSPGWRPAPRRPRGWRGRPRPRPRRRAITTQPATTARATTNGSGPDPGSRSSASAPHRRSRDRPAGGSARPPTRPRAGPPWAPGRRAATICSGLCRSNRASSTIGTASTAMTISPGRNARRPRGRAGRPAARCRPRPGRGGGPPATTPATTPGRRRVGTRRRGGSAPRP